MMDPVAAQFISSLVKSLQMLCHSCMDFDDNIEIIGHINLRIDNQRKLDYIVNEQVSKQGHESTCFQSNSYHSLPPSKTRLEREQQSIGGSSDTTNIISHHKLDGSVPVLGGTHIQVDLSGPSPVTRSTYTSYPDGFSSTMGSSQLYFQSRNSQPHKIEMEQSSASVSQNDCTLSQSANVTKDSDETVCADGRDGTGTDSQMSLAMFPDTDGQLQIVPEPTQDVVVKTEPDDQLHSSLEKAGGSTGTAGMIEVSSAGSTFTAMQQTAVSSTNAHSDQVTLSTVPVTARSQPVSFNASLVPLNMLGSEKREAGQARSASEHTTPVSLMLGGCGFNRTTPVSTIPGPDSLLHAGNTCGSHQLDSNRHVCDSGQNGSQMSSMFDSSHGSPEVKNVLPTSAQNSSGWWCSICSKSFRCGDLLSMHMQFVHRKPVPSISSSEGHQPAGMPTISQSLMSTATSADSETLSIEPSILSQNFLSDIVAADLFQSDNKMSTSLPSTSQTLRPQFTDCRMKEFQPYLQNSWHQDNQTSTNSVHNGVFEPQLSNSSQLLVSGGQSAQTLSDPFYVYPSFSPPSEGGNIINSNYSSASCSFGTPSSLTSRMLSRPSFTRRKPYRPGSRCKHCHKIFHFNNAQFVDHVQSCTKEKVGLECGQCGRSFASKVALKDHEDSMHSRKGFQCRACGLVFKWRTYVYQHRYKCAAYRIKKEVV